MRMVRKKEKENPLEKEKRLNESKFSTSGGP